MCCECGRNSHTNYFIPYAKRGRALVFVCHECYTNHDYDYYFFRSPHKVKEISQ